MTHIASHFKIVLNLFTALLPYVAIYWPRNYWMQIEVSSVNCRIKIAQPLNVNKVDHQVQAYIKELRKAGAPVNTVIRIIVF